MKSLSGTDICIPHVRCSIIHNSQDMEYYSAIKKNEIMPFAGTWMDLEMIILSEVRERQISYDVTYI